MRLSVVMSMDIDEARGDERAGRVKFVRSRRSARADEGDLSVGDFNIGGKSWRASAVDDAAAANNEVWRAHDDVPIRLEGVNMTGS